MDPNLIPNTAPSSAVRDPSFEVIQPPPNSKPPLSRRTIVIIGVVTLLLVSGGVIAAVVTSRGNKTLTVTPTTQPGVSSTERTALGDTSSGGPTLLQVTQVIADTGTFKALQVTADTSVGGILTVAGNGTFGGTLSASNLAGSGTGITGVNAALLNGQTGAYYTNAANLQGSIADNKLSANVALRNSPNTFSVGNIFNGGIDASSVGTGTLNVSGSTSLSGTTTISSLLLAAPLAVSNGGTGVTTIPVNGVVFGQGTTAVGTAVPSGAGQCLISTSTTVQFGSCSGAIGTGVSSLDLISGDITLGNSSAAGTTVTIDNSTTTTKGISSFNATNFTVTSGVVNTIQNIAVSSSPAFAGLSLGSPLLVSSGGTGARNLPTNSVIIGQGTGAVSAVTSASAGQCLVSTSGSPVFATCPQPVAVLSLNGQSGTVTVANASATSGTITIDSATTAAKGIASFNPANFSVTAGAVNTIQNIAVGSTPTFAGLSLSSPLAISSGGTGSNTAAGARGTIGAAAAGSNSDITSLTGLTTAISTAQGGTGVVTTATNGQILIGNSAGFSLNTLTAGAGVSITNSAGGITIAATTGGTCASCANSSLSNLSAVAINTSLLPGTAGSDNLGSTILPFGQLAIAGTSSNPATNNFLITGASTSGTRTIRLPDASGTIAVSATGPLSIDALGNVSCSTCLTSGGGGAGGVSSVNSATGALTLQGVSAGSISVAGSTITVADATSAVKGLASFNNANFSVTSGSVNTIQNISSSASPSFAGISLSSALSISNGGTGATSAPGALSNLGAAARGTNTDITSLGGLTTALTVAQGGTGTTSLTSGGVVLGNGASALSAITGTNGQCLVIVGSTPTFTTCTGAGGVSRINSQTGAVTVANASASANTITINDATTAAKGIASFNSTNFTAGSGIINTIQNISTTSAPTFGQLFLTGTNSLNVGTSATTAGSIKFYDGSSTFGATINTTTLSAARTISLPNETGTICLQNSANCGFLTGAAASGSYISLQSTTPGSVQTGNLNISGTGIFGTSVATSNLTATGQTILGGATNQNQLIVQAGPGQTNSIPLIGFEDSSGNVTGGISYDSKNNALFGAAAGSYTTGAGNVGIGLLPLLSNTTGSQNVGIGSFASGSNITGNYNTAIGYSAGYTDSGSAFYSGANLQNATAVGAFAQVQTSNSLVLGSVTLHTKVGIGTTEPTNTLSVSPVDIGVGVRATRTNGSAALFSNDGNEWDSTMVGDSIVFADGTTNTVASVTDGSHVVMDSVYSGTTDASPVYYRFHKIGFQVATTGNVGIGMNPTTNALSVQGTVTATALQQNGNTVCDSSSNCTNYLSSTTGVQLQPTSPGTSQTGNLNISGSGIFGNSVVTSSLNVNGQATISGSTNQPQLIIKSASGSTNSGSLILLEDSTGNEVSRISSDLFANTSLGAYTNQSLTTGNNNTAIGSAALASNTLGSGNTSTGSYSLQHETNGSGNTADGYRTLENNYTGSYNSALGYNAGGTDSNGHFLTGGALQNATAIGAFAQVQTSNSLVLGSVDTQTNIGIGTTEPTNTLSVSPLDYQAGTAARNSFSTSLVGTGTSWTSAMVGDTIIFSDATTNVVSAVIDATHITMAAAYNNTGDSAPGSYYRFHHVGLQVASSGNVGIGTNPNSNALTVQGTVAATSIQQSGNTVCDSSSNCTNYLTAATGVELQPYTPGTPQVGVLNISGSAYVGNGYVGASQLVVRSTDNLPTHPALLFTDNSGSELARINVDNSYNLGIGGNALVGSFGQFNTAIGALSQGSATGGASDNVSLGSFALYQNSGNLNTAVGNYALYSNGSGTNNAALGAASLNSNVTGSYNSALGFNAGATDKNNYISTGSNLQNATAIGAYAQVQASNSIVLGSVDNQTNVGIGITVPSNQFSVSPLDYQTGTVTRTNGSAVLVGTGTTWTNSMAGDIATFADGTTATIVSVSDSTHATMAVAYGISTGSVGHYRFHRPGFQVTSAGNAYVQNTSTTAFQIQNSLGTSLLSADTSTMTVTVTNVVVSLNLTVNGHIISGGTNPTIVAGTAACTSPTVTVAGTDTAGLITVTTGTGCTVSGKLATLSFATAFGAAPRVTITPGTATAASLSTFIDSSTIATTTFDLDTTVTAASSTTYKWYYHAVQ